MAPIFLVVLLLISLMLHLAANRSGGVESRSQIITRYLTLFFFLTYLVLPSASTTIFGAFTCRSIDPDNVMPGTPLYLRNDLSISCSSPRYRFGVHWATAMIFVYPIGITCLYAYVLYVNRGDIINQRDSAIPVVVSIPSSIINVSSTEETISPSPCAKDAFPPSTSASARSGVMQYVTSKEIEFLHKAYEGRCWYWEVVETIRRLLLTAFLSVITVGTAAGHLNCALSVFCLPICSCLFVWRCALFHVVAGTVYDCFS